MIQEKKLSPNIKTFGCLAYRVGTADLLEEFLKDLKVNAKPPATLSPIADLTLFLVFKGFRLQAQPRDHLNSSISRLPRQKRQVARASVQAH